MFATLLGAILALTAGVMLTQSYRELEHSKTSLQFQRELTFAIDVIRREIHESAETNITVAAEQLTIQKSGYTTTFSKQDTDLVCDPNTTSAGDESVLIDGTLQDFSPLLNKHWCSHLIYTRPQWTIDLNHNPLRIPQ